MSEWINGIKRIIARVIIVLGDIYTVPWTDITSSCSFTGWVSRTETRVYSKIVGETVDLWFRVVGTSNLNTCKITTPYNGKVTNWIFPVLTTNSGAQKIGYCSKSSSSGIITFIYGATGGVSGWATTGIKAVYGHIRFEKT